MNKAQNNKIRLMCMAGMMAAMYVGLDFLAVSISVPFAGNLKISLSGLPVLIMAVFGGPIWGAATGFTGAFIGQMLTYGFSATTILWILPAVVRGFSMGLLFRAFRSSTQLGILTLETCLTSVLVTLCNTGAMLVEQKLYGYYQSFFAIYVAIPPRLLVGIVTAIVYAILLPRILDALNRRNIVKRS